VHRRPHLSSRLSGLATGIVVAGLAACSDGAGSPDVGPAPAAVSTACATALLAAPAAVLDRPRTPLDVDGALSYGSPAVVVRCGLAALPPTAERDCVGVDDVDWVLVSAADDDPVVVVTYGRAPALEVRVPVSVGRENATAALVDVAAVARALPGNGRACVG
jgi:hypothetical protein